MATPQVELKQLGWLKMVGTNAALIVWNLYEFAKNKSGPFKSIIQNVENHLLDFFRPAYIEFREYPMELLVFFDREVDEASHLLDKYAPTIAKITSKVLSMINKALALVEIFVEKAIAEGLIEAISYVAKLCMEFIVSLFIKMWLKATIHLPFLPGLSGLAIPIVSNLANKYNNLIKDLPAKGLGSLTSFVPLVPVEEMEKAYKQAAATAAKQVADIGGSVEHLVKDLPEKGVEEAIKHIEAASKIAADISGSVGSLVEGLPGKGVEEMEEAAKKLADISGSLGSLVSDLPGKGVEEAEKSLKQVEAATKMATDITGSIGSLVSGLPGKGIEDATNISQSIGSLAKDIPIIGLGLNPKKGTKKGENPAKDSPAKGWGGLF